MLLITVTAVPLALSAIMYYYDRRPLEAAQGAGRGAANRTWTSYSTQNITYIMNILTGQG